MRGMRATSTSHRYIRGGAALHPGSIRTRPASARLTFHHRNVIVSASPDAEVEASLRTYWAEAGEGELKEWQVDRIVNSLLRSKDAAATDVARLSSALAALSTALGESVSPLELVAADVDALLAMSPAMVAAALAELGGALPGADVYQMVCKQPMLLQVGEGVLGDRTRAALSKLEEVYPYRKDMHEIPSVLEEYPQLILRLGFYPDAAKVEELPIDLQNCIFRNYCA